MSPTAFSLDGSVAIVTGSTRGIGAGIAERLAEVGASVVVSGRTVDDGEAVVDSITDDGGTAIFNRTDVREPAEIEALIETAVAEFDGLDILVNNAGFETDTAPDEIDLETWDAIIETDFRAYWLAANYAYPYLVESDTAAVVHRRSNPSFPTRPNKVR